MVSPGAIQTRDLPLRSQIHEPFVLILTKKPGACGKKETVRYSPNEPYAEENTFSISDTFPDYWTAPGHRPQNSKDVLLIFQGELLR